MEIRPARRQLLIYRLRACAALLLCVALGAYPLALFAPEWIMPWAALCLAVLLALCLWYLPARQGRTLYTVSDDGVSVRSGLIKIKTASARYSGVQYVSLTQSPLQRALGLSQLRLHLAGGSIVLQGLEHILAIELAKLAAACAREAGV